jgi:hypothetical protein
MSRAPRNLVIVRAGDRSLHPAWTSSLETREWDLVVSYFGSDPSVFRGPGERRIDDKGPKCPGLHALLMREDFWRQYDYIWLPDDDLMIDQQGIDRLFARTADLGLALSQPALSWRSFYSYAVTLCHPSFAVRFTNFVEIMGPCFERKFLEASLPLLGETQSGWGVGWVLAARLSGRVLACGILDDVEMTHTRPVGGPIYAALRERGISAAEERVALLLKHGVAADVAPLIYAAIHRSGRHLDAFLPADRPALQSLLAADAMAFQQSRTKIETPHVIVQTGRPQRPRTWGW